MFLFNSKHGVGAVIRALQSKGLFQSLAEPNLIRVNGKEASFLAGGEYPYPVVQSAAAATRCRIMFKEYGIRLHFTPTVLGGDLINLKVKPEVSSLDFTNAIVLDGFRIPALTTRRAETEVELQDGQTFAIAGLMNNTLNSTMSEDSRHRRHPGARLPVQEPRVSEEPDRARRDDHADNRHARIARACRRACRRWSSRTWAPPSKTLPTAGAVRRVAALSGDDEGPAPAPAASSETPAAAGVPQTAAPAPLPSRPVSDAAAAAARRSERPSRSQPQAAAPAAPISRSRRRRTARA